MKNEKENILVSFQLSREEKKVLEDGAKLEERKVSEYIREKCIDSQEGFMVSNGKGKYGRMNNDKMVFKIVDTKNEASITTYGEAREIKSLVEKISKKNGKKNEKWEIIRV